MTQEDTSIRVTDPGIIAEGQARSLYEQALVTNFAALLVALLFYFLLESRVESRLPALWLSALVVTASARLGLWHLRRRKPDLVSPQAWLRYYLVGSALVGLSWSLIYPLIYSANDPFVAISLFMLIFGIVGSAVAVLAVYLPAFVVYCYPQILTLIILTLAHGGQGAHLLALGCAVYLGMTTLYVRNTNRSLMKSIAVQAQNAALIDDLNAEIGLREGLIGQRTTELREKNEALRKSEERFLLAMQGTNDGVFDWDLVSNEIDYSPRCKGMLGFAPDELASDLATWEDRLDPVDRDRSRQMMDDYIGGRRDDYALELKVRHKDGHWVDILVRAFLVRDREGRAIRVVGTHVDITQKKRQEERVIHQAHYDALTNLPNRFLALDRLSQMTKEAAREKTRIAVLFLDLDGFKLVNDSLGHETGDRLLVQAAQRLRGCVRGSDSVCRLGGDEFVLLLRGLHEPGDTETVTKNLVSSFRTPFTLDERELVVTASIGIAIYPDDAANPAELLRNADTAMYRAKEQGRNTYYRYTGSMSREVSRRLSLAEQLHGALARGEFNVVYQPLVNLQAGSVIGAEALLRWHSRVLGDISPDEFIPAAEQSGTIVELGNHVLHRALESVGRWNRDLNMELKITVNISPRQFRDQVLVDTVREVLQRHRVQAASLELEITEGVLMGNQAHVDEALAILSDLGVGIAMDDFGTGYSSLSYLRNFPFDALKIDREFVGDIGANPADRELVNAIILMAHGLGLKVVAEGVESEEQRDYLRAKGCDYAQGYLFSKPLSAEAFPRWVAEWGLRPD